MKNEFYSDKDKGHKKRETSLLTWSDVDLKHLCVFP